MKLRKLLMLLCAVSMMSGTVMAADATSHVATVTDGDWSAAKALVEGSAQKHNEALARKRAAEEEQTYANWFADGSQNRAPYGGRTTQDPSGMQKMGQYAGGFGSSLWDSITGIPESVGGYWNHHMAVPQDENAWLRRELSPGARDANSPHWYNYRLVGRVPGAANALIQTANVANVLHSLGTDEYQGWRALMKLLRLNNTKFGRKMASNDRGMRAVRSLLGLLQALAIHEASARAVGATSFTGSLHNAGSAGVSEWGTKVSRVPTIKATTSAVSDGSSDGSGDDSLI